MWCARKQSPLVEWNKSGGVAAAEFKIRQWTNGGGGANLTNAQLPVVWVSAL